MVSDHSSRRSWLQLATSVLALSGTALAYRPVQFCKPLGENEHYSACTSLTQHYNESTQVSDLYVRYHWYKYEDSKNGWHSFGIGKRMAGALMFVMYGDPNLSVPMTFSVRSASGHVPPRPLAEMDEFQTAKVKARTPAVDVTTSKFVPYTGSYVNPTYSKTPSHVGIAEFVVRGYAKWIGTEVSNTSTSQPMIWSSRYNQDFGDDFSADRGIEAHKMGLGFGWLYVDLLNALTPIPMFGPIDDSLTGVKGATEFDELAPPTAEELAEGERIINAATLPASPDSSNGIGAPLKLDEHNPFDSHDTSTSINPPSANDPNSQTTPEPDTSSSTGHSNLLAGIAVRNWLWHLHGILMILAFLILYPLGIYFIRRPAPTSFNYHWTIQALGTLVFAIGAFVGYVQSHAIHLPHQYAGIAMSLALGLQMLGGWRHHVAFLVIRRRTWISHVHIWAGRIILPVGFVNIMSGMRLRGYGWFTMLLVLIVMVVEVVLGGIYLWRSARRKSKESGASELKAVGPSAADDAEEYFQLAGGDDDFSESDDGVDDVLAKRREEKRKENERLAKLDRV